MLFALTFVLVIGFSSSTPIWDPTIRPMPFVLTTTEGPATQEELLALVNAARMEIGVAPLAIDKRLSGSAQRKADDMAQYDYFGHINPHDGSFGPSYVLDTGIQCLSAGETLRQVGDVNANDTAARVVNAWLANEPHRGALLNPRYVLTGFGISGVYFVEHFCAV